MYLIVYLDCIVIKVRQDKQVINKSIFLALGINTEGHNKLMGMWIAEKEGAKFWLNVLTELQNRGVQDILMACVDGLKGFPDAINAVFPQSHNPTIPHSHIPTFTHSHIHIIPRSALYRPHGA